MNALEKLQTLFKAIGLRRFVIATVVTTVLASYEWLRNHFPGLPFPQIPAWVLASLTALTLINWWTLGYATELDIAAKPKMRIRFDPTFTEMRAAPNNSNKNIRAYWVRLENASTTEVQNCKVNIESITRDGINLINFVDSLKRRITGGEVFPLRDGDPKDVDVIMMDEAASPPKMEVCFWRENHKNFSLSNGNYVFNLAAVASNSTVSRKSFRVRISDAGQLQFEEDDKEWLNWIGIG